MVGWVTPSDRAAAPSVPWRAIARKISRSFHSKPAHPMHNCMESVQYSSFPCIPTAPIIPADPMRRPAMTTMKAAVLETYGAVRLTEIERPVPQAGEVLVRVKASGVNPLDLKIKAGQAAHARHPLPAILGIDLAGVVEALGPGVTAFKPGDEVYGMTGGVGGVPGALAEFSAVDARLLAPKPANFSMREAAALPLVFITAWEGLVDRAKLE